MANANRSKGIDRQIALLKAVRNKKVETGWFASDRYQAEDGALVGRSMAAVARLNEFGGTISHPGGTKYITDAVVKGKFVGSRFVSDEFQGDHKVTGPHTIDIPARPFMRLAHSKFQGSRAKIQAKIAGQLVKGTISPDQALGQIGLEMEGCIVDSIKHGGWEPNAASTIAKKGFDRPLIESSKMFQNVNSKVS